MTSNRDRSMFSQLPFGRDQARQRASHAGDDASFALQTILHRPDHGIEPAEHALRVNPAHIGVDPFVFQGVAVDVQCDAAVSVGVDLHTDAAHLAAAQRQRRRRTPVAGRVLRLSLLDDSRVNQQRHQQRHRRLSQPGFLGEIGPAHRRGGAQKRVDHHRKIVIAQIVLIDPAKRCHSRSRPCPVCRVAASV